MKALYSKSIFLIASLIFLASCDKDYNDIGANIVGDDHYGFTKYNGASILAFTQKTGPIQSSNLPVNALGIYNNPVFGKMTASFATQVQLASTAPVIDLTLNQAIDSVILNVPYFNKLKSTNDDGSHVYTLDSIYGNLASKIKLSIYESGYTMRDLDPLSGFLDAQAFYTDQYSDFDSQKIGSRLNNSIEVAQNDAFTFNPKELKLTTVAVGSTPATRNLYAPSMRLKLDNNYFLNKIIHASSDKLLTNNAFKNYFKGLFFKVEQSDSDEGCLSMMNFKNGTITIYYKEDFSTTDHTESDRVQRNIVLNLSGNTANLINTDYSTSGITYNSLPNTGNVITGDSKLYLKGGEGSVALIDLFGSIDLKGYNTTTGLWTNQPNAVPDELDELRSNKWLINEANLTFYIDQANMNDGNNNPKEPNRIFVYEVNNKRPLIDYYYDATSSSYPNYNKYIHGGIIDNGSTVFSTGRGIKYKVRITNYIKNLLKYSDSTNVRIGVSVSQSISNAVFGKQKSYPYNFSSALTPNQLHVEKNKYYFPLSSVMSPLGTVLYGTNPAVPDDKKLKLEIYYTKPD